MMGVAPPPTVGRNQSEAPAAAARRIESAMLLGDQRELIIAHGEDTYRLRLTSKGKLILTK